MPQSPDVSNTVVPATHRQAAPRSRSRRVGLVSDGAGPSLVTENDELRRKRILGAALFLACTFAVFLLWSLGGNSVNYNTLTRGSLVVRGGIAAAVAAYVRRKGIARRNLLAAEYLLFGGCIALTLLNQYFLNLHDLRGHQPIAAVASIKNGVLATVILMVIYGILIPNNAQATTRVVIPVALAQAAVLALVVIHPDVKDEVEVIRKNEHFGMNAIFLAVGAGLSIYGSWLLNGLRTQLHEARKYGQYKLGRKLGSGGMGDIYLAEHALLKRPCALKLIKPESSANPTALARFELEVQSTARLAHHNTVEIYDYGHTEDGTFYYVMEYLRGMGLGDLVRVYGPMHPGRMIYLMRQACAGLYEAHLLGLVHRDIKPANIFVACVGGETDVAKVLDFGLVRPTRGPEADSFTAEHTVSGTPHFMSPEQALGSKAIDPRSDIYALGCLMYHALTGRPPFSGDSAMAVMTAHARDAAPPPSTLRPDLAPDLEAVVLRCLAKSPADRFPTARALSDALAECRCAATWGPDLADAWWKSSSLLESVGPAVVDQS